jgi:ketosteroid isomerase-like protein
MPFDPMAVVIDWLDAYRAGDIEAILDMFAKPLPAARHCVPIGSIASGNIRQAR